MTVKIVNKSTHQLPNYETITSAGMDIRANIDAPIVLKPLERTIVKTGLFIELPIGSEAQVRPRSGLAAKKGITVNTVNPGFIETDLTEDASSELRQALLSRAAIPKLLSPEAVASAVVFLASVEAWAITGQTLNVDCGVVKL